MRILMYHEITQEPPEEIHGVSRTAFNAQMRWLHQAGYRTVTLSDWLEAANSRTSQISTDAIIITFDDGYRDNYTTAWPILAGYGFVATIFLVTGRMGQTADWRPGALGRAPLLAWPEVRAMAQAGLRFGSHTTSHVDLNACPTAVAEQELRGSRESIEQALGVPVESLSYPFSRFNPQVKTAVGQVGYRVACSCPTGYVGTTNNDPYDLRRITMLATDQLTNFVAKVRGDWRVRLGWYRRVVGLWRRRLLGARA